MSQDVFIAAGARTPMGGLQGDLSSLTAVELGEAAIRAVLARANLEGGAVDEVIMGCVLPSGLRQGPARQAAIDAGIPVSVGATTINKLCGSGMKAAMLAFDQIKAGTNQIMVAGGMESMSRAPYIVPDQRWGAKMGDIRTLDMMLGALHCPFGTGHMGVTAENVAAEHGVSRDDQDAFALQSQERAAAAIAAGYFKEQIVPVEVTVKRQAVMFDTDEHPKATSLAALGGLKTVFRKDGTVTAGNASGINDGAAAIVLARGDAAAKAGLTPRARVIGYAHAGVRPEVMGIGPVPAVENLLKRTGLKITDFDVIESNEAFAAQAIAVNKGLGLDPAKVNPNGGAIALGHPVGATGAIITVKALYELERTQGKRALITMCIGGGQGIALAIERM